MANFVKKKHMKSNQNFVNLFPKFNESLGKRFTYIELNNISDIDHTRIIKWMYKNIKNDYDIKKSNNDYLIDVNKLSKNEFDDLINYLQSQNYLE